MKNLVWYYNLSDLMTKSYFIEGGIEVFNKFTVQCI